MKKQEVLDLMNLEGLIPVVRVSSSQEAMDVAEALQSAGVSLIEITMTVQGALRVIKELSGKLREGVVLGALRPSFMAEQQELRRRSQAPEEEHRKNALAKHRSGHLGHNEAEAYRRKI